MERGLSFHSYLFFTIGATPRCLSKYAFEKPFITSCVKYLFVLHRIFMRFSFRFFNCICCTCSCSCSSVVVCIIVILVFVIFFLLLIVVVLLFVSSELRIDENNLRNCLVYCCGVFEKLTHAFLPILVWHCITLNSKSRCEWCHSCKHIICFMFSKHELSCVH